MWSVVVQCAHCVVWLCSVQTASCAVCSVVVQRPEGETRPGAIPRGGNIEAAPPSHKGDDEDDDGRVKWWSRCDGISLKTTPVRYLVKNSLFLEFSLFVS